MNEPMNKTNINVFALGKEDHAAWQNLYKAYAGFYHMPMTDETLKKVWSWLFDDKKSFYGLIAKNEQGTALGLMHFREMVSPLRGAEVGFLDDLYIDPAARGTGTVDLMFARLKQEAELHGWPFVRWVTADDNYRGRAVYDRLSDRTQWLTYQMNSDKT